ncbi:hypothetical protein Pmani_026868 [Petrolisthes manimaculis]|uniref:Uncharacterized protein n=1 Tax=Petrolisthes manimaculis TaxID=1843537 RepID=A0AAE1TWA2_9EUCA|nr:hypothetical protein Pmani_026868 [Petrolisthes manimaculis]
MSYDGVRSRPHDWSVYSISPGPCTQSPGPCTQSLLDPTLNLLDPALNIKTHEKRVLPGADLRKGRGVR